MSVSEPFCFLVSLVFREKKSNRDAERGKKWKMEPFFRVFGPTPRPASALKLCVNWWGQFHRADLKKKRTNVGVGVGNSLKQTWASWGKHRHSVMVETIRTILRRSSSCVPVPTAFSHSALNSRHTRAEQTRRLLRGLQLNAWLLLMVSQENFTETRKKKKGKKNVKVATTPAVGVRVSLPLWFRAPGLKETSVHIQRQTLFNVSLSLWNRG